MTRRARRWTVGAVYTGLGLALVLGVLAKPWPTSDYWVHLGAVRTLAQGGDLNGMPFARERALLDRHRDPYHAFWALAARGLPWSGTDVLTLAGTVNVLVLLLGAAVLAHCLRRGARFALALLLVLLFGWGIGYAWSNEYYFSILPRVAAYPSTLAWGLSWMAFGLVHAASRRGGAGGWVAAVVLAAVVVSIHPLTALGFTLPFPVLWVWLGPATWRRRGLALLYAVAAAGLSLAWPHASLLDQLRTVTGSGFVQGAMRPEAESFLRPTQMLIALGPAPIGIFLLAWAPRSWRRSAGAAIAAYLLLWVGASFLGIRLAHRVVFFLVFAMHLPMAVALHRGWAAQRRHGGRAVRRAGWALAGLLLVPWASYHVARTAGYVRARVSASAPFLRPSPVGEFERSAVRLAEMERSGARVLADRHAAHALAAFGVRTLPPGGVRLSYGGFGAEEFRAVARPLIAEHAVTHVVLQKEHQASKERRWLEGLGDVAELPPDLLLLTLTRPADAAQGR